MTDPYDPHRGGDWSDCFAMLCMHCRHMPGCDVVEGMIEMQEGGAWPEGGWVTDKGAGVSCLTYQPREMKRLSRQQLRQAVRRARSSRCDGCAARKGSEASVALHTRRDFRAAVESRALFVCHEDGGRRTPCAGWAQAVTAGRRKRDNV